MKPVDFDNTRRHLRIMLLGQELSELQAVELCDIITTTVDISKYMKNPAIPAGRVTSPEMPAGDPFEAAPRFVAVHKTRACGPSIDPLPAWVLMAIADGHGLPPTKKLTLCARTLPAAHSGRG